MEKALIHKSDGTSTVVEFEIGQSYPIISKAVGGLIELVALAPNLEMWVNENFLAEAEEKGLKVNAVATAMYSAELPKPYPILGDVIFTGGTDDEGDTLGLADDVLRRLQIIIERAQPLIEMVNARNAE